ncbi:hypothetical protein [Streptomyces sp. NPDC060035]|uniref:hypothetical protein n=1 Tax=Streptomyces sp. NPDC060035 TaxID=3347044 RepID=UPI0036B6C368
MATTLGRATLPRQQFVHAFARACGLGEEEIRQRLQTRRHIAANGPAPTRDKGGSKDGDDRGPASAVPVWLREMAAADPSVRDKALGHFYSAAHHQGDVYACTTASCRFSSHWPTPPRHPTAPRSSSCCSA